MRGRNKIAKISFKSNGSYTIKILHQFTEKSCSRVAGMFQFFEESSIFVASVFLQQYFEAQEAHT